MSEHRISPHDVDLERGADTVTVNIEYTAPEKKHQSIIHSFDTLAGVKVLVDY